MQRLGNYVHIRTGRLDANAADENGQYPFFTCAQEISRINQWSYDCECVLIAGNCNPHVFYYSGKFNAYQRVYIIESINKELLNVKYLYYFFKIYMTLAKERQRGAIEKFFCMDDFTEIKLSLPSLPDQLRIAGILGSIDEKIAVNRRKIAELEALAKTIYDYWFVQFDFPDADGRPYRSSGGKMVWNEQLKREIPEGWEVGNICKIAEIMSGGTPAKGIDKFWGGEIPFFGPTDVDDSIYQFETAEYITPIGLKNCASKLFDENTVIITARGSIGKAILVGKPMAMNQSCYALKAMSNEYGYLWFLTKQLIEHLKVKSSGSVFKSIIASDIEYSILSLGEKSIIGRYCEFANPIFDEIKALSRSSFVLTRQRDTLLPLLMNGQVKVRE